MRILLATGEQYAGGIIQSLSRSGHDIAGIISPKKGLFIESSWRILPRYFRCRFGTIKSFQDKLNIPTRVCNSLGDGSLRTWIRNLQPDLLLVLGWPKLMPDSFLQLFSDGAINIHPSVLPLLRGADPIFSSILTDAEGYGITFHQMAKEIDKGNVILQKPLKREKHDSYETLYFRFIRVAIRLTPLILKALHGNPVGNQQVGQPSRTTRFHWRHAIYSSDDSPESAVRKTLACYSHHKMHALCGKILFSFTHCTAKKSMPAYLGTTPVIRSVGFRKITLQHGHQLIILSGIKLIGSSPWLSPLLAVQQLKKGQALMNESEVRQKLKRIKKGTS